MAYPITEGEDMRSLGCKMGELQRCLGHWQYGLDFKGGGERVEQRSHAALGSCQWDV